jgi:hypothetical protein
MEGNSEHKGTEGKDIEKEDEPKASPISDFPIMVKHFVKDKRRAEQKNKGKPFKVQSLKDISKGEKGKGNETQSEPPLLEERRLHNLLLGNLLR